MIAFLSKIKFPLIFLSSGILFAFLLIPYELEQMHWEVPGMPASYPIEQMMRPILLFFLCFIPFIGSIIYGSMGTMSRYIAKSFIHYFLLCTIIMLMIYIMADFTENLDRFRSRFDDPLPKILSFYASQLPMFLYQILPYTMLMGTLWCLSKFSESSELTGMLQSGRSILRLCLPIFIFASLFSVVYGICGFHWAPNGAQYRQITFHKSKNPDGSPMPIIYRSEINSRIWHIKNPATMDAPGEPLKQVDIIQFCPFNRGKLLHQWRAEEASWNKSESTWTLKKCYKRLAVNHDTNLQNDAFYESITLDFSEKPYQIISPMQAYRNDTMGTSALYEYISSHAGSREDRNRKRTEWHVRIARIFTCIILVALAIPSAISFQRRGTMKSIAFAILLAALMLFFYRVFPTLGESGLIQAWISAWIPNFCYILITIWLFKKRLAHRSFKEWFKAKSNGKA